MTSSCTMRTAVGSLLLVALSACSTTSVAPTSKPQAQAALTPAPPPAPGPVEIDLATLPGNYGLASYQREQDRERTLKQAKIGCRDPFPVKAGSNGGIVMHSAGQSKPTEVFLKKDGQGKSFLGPKGPAGGTKDQRIVSYENRILTTQPMNERLRSVYGTVVLVPCA